MKLAILSEYFHPAAGATGKVLYQLAESLARVGWVDGITVFAGERQHRSNGGTSSQATPAPEGVQLRLVRTARFPRSTTAGRLVGDALFTLRTLGHALMSQRPDMLLVVTNPPSLPLAAWLLWKLRRVPYVYLVHDVYPDIAAAVGATSASSAGYRMFRWLQQRLLRDAQRVIALGRCMQEVLADRYGIGDDRVTVIPNWADDHVLKSDVRLRDEEGEKRGSRAFVILYAGNLGLFHDFDTVLDAARALQKTSPEVTFRIVGDGAQRPYVTSRIRSEGLSNVVVSDFVPETELPQLLSEADIVLVTLRAGAEGLAVPLKAYNTLAAGKPILAVMSPDAEVARLVVEHGCGLQVTQGDVAALVDTIQELSAAPGVVLAMGKRARQAAVNRYTRLEAVKQYERVLAEAKPQAVRVRSPVP